MAKQKDKKGDLIISLMLNLGGMLIMSFFKRVALKRLDKGQMWTFSIVISVAQFFCLATISGRLYELLIAHVGIDFGLFLMVLLLQFGFHADLLDRLADDYFR